MSASKVKLLSGNYMPSIGLGTFQINGSSEIYQTLDRALELGYRALDTAAVYGNERDIGDALSTLLPKHGLTREDIHITTKLAPNRHSQDVIRSITQSIQKLRCNYLDLYLVHWPGRSMSSTKTPREDREDVWTEMIKAKQNGLTKDIGVSNFTIQHLTEIIKHPSGIKPVVNQVEWHPYCWEEDLLKFCQDNGIILQAYSPLGGTNNPELQQDPVITKIANKLQRSTASVLLRWVLQTNSIVIPKARSTKHLKDNISLDFTIPDEDMVAINSIKSRKQKKFAWDPKTQAS